MYAVSLTHPGFLAVHSCTGTYSRDIVIARLSCMEMCGILIKTVSTVLFFQGYCSLQIFPDCDFKQKKCGKTNLIACYSLFSHCNIMVKSSIALLSRTVHILCEELQEVCLLAACSVELSLWWLRKAFRNILASCFKALISFGNHLNIRKPFCLCLVLSSISGDPLGMHSNSYAYLSR